jgi:S-ribosylhomocysteine lyase LuxS involved in autoinducer biosynthesis
MATYTYIGDSNPDGCVIGVASVDKVGFYGATPISQRTGYATSLVGTASSADVTTNLKAAVIEIQNTLSLLGIWAAQA